MDNKTNPKEKTCEALLKYEHCVLNLWDEDLDSVKKGVKMSTDTHAPKERECIKKEGPNVKTG